MRLNVHAPQAGFLQCFALVFRIRGCILRGLRDRHVFLIDRSSSVLARRPGTHLNVDDFRILSMFIMPGLLACLAN
jgi:hypothetical protein